MGKTFKKQASVYDDEFSSKRSGKHANHANGRKTGGMKTLNSYVEQDYDFEDYDPFDDEIEIKDDITIQHTKNTNNTP
jgi:hypothetical protein